MFYLTNKEAEAVYYTVIKHDGRLRTRGKCRKHAAQASVFYISRVFSNVRSFLSQCNIVLTCVTVLTSKIPHKVENKLPPNSKIQETDPLISLRFGTRRFTIYMCPSSKRLCSIRLPNFFVNDHLLYFGDGRNYAAFFIEFEPRAVFSYSSRI